MSTSAPVNRSINNQGDGRHFDRTVFEYDATRDSYVCPAGQLLQRKQLQRNNRLILYAAAAESCSACDLKARCTRSTRRYVTRHLNEEALQRLAARTTTVHMKLRRETVERPFAELKWRIFGHPRFLVRGRHRAAPRWRSA